MKKIIFPYVRFSTTEQKKGASLQRQINKIKKYAKKNKFIIDDGLDLRDLGKSGYSGENLYKGSLGRFIQAIEEQRIPLDGSAYLCIEQIDRLSRQNIDNASELFKKILKNNVNIITLMDERVYTKSSVNNLTDIIYSLFLMEQANLESEKKSERILDAFDQKLEKLNKNIKVQFAGMFPGWIDNNGTKYETKFVFNDKIKTVKKIFKMYKEDYSLADITKYLDDNNYPQVAKKRHVNFTNRWSSGKVSHLLSNRCVIGELKVKRTGEIFKSYYPSIISVEDFNLVNAKKQRKVITKTAGKKSINIFSGKLFCGKCGQKVYFETDEKKTKTKTYIYHMLKCSTKRYRNCNSGSLRYDDFLNSSHNFFNLLKNESSYSKQKIKENNIKVRELKLIIETDQLKLTNLEESFEKGDYDMELFLNAGTVIKKNIRKLKAEVSNLELLNAKNNNYGKLNKFDKNNPEHIRRAKIKIDNIYAAFVLFPDQSTFFEIKHNGAIAAYPLKNTKSKGDHPVFKSFAELTDNIKQEYYKGTLDGKFMDILNAINLWDAKADGTIKIDSIETDLDLVDFSGYLNV
jgi:DNA invertase Pin-like site-specific DNA recombinase